MKIVDKRIADLKDADYNPRKLSKHQEKTIRDSLAEFGFVDPIVINTHTGRKNVIIGGHQRRKVWAKMGHKTVPCIEVDLPLAKERELNIRLNQNMGEWDWELLATEFEMDDLLKWGFELDDFGMDLDQAGDGEKEIDENIETDHECPKCGYKW